jgi:hypothetical protein
MITLPSPPPLPPSSHLHTILHLPPPPLTSTLHHSGKVDGTAVALFKCHPNGTAECGYKNQQWR